MSGLMSRTVILTVSRLSNFAIHLLSPLLLVRILDVAAYGQYQEFLIYATLLTVVSSFAVDSSLTYFLPRYPEREQALVSQTSAITLALSTVCLLALMLGKPLVLKLVSYDFVAPLSAYVFFFVNLNWLEYYWIAKRQPRHVLYYSAVRLIVRVSVLLLVAYVTRDVLTILWSLVAVEALRVFVVVVYFARRRIFVADLRRTEVVEQLRFASPIGAAQVVQSAGRDLGKIVIASTLGPVALAYYAIGSYLQPVVRALRSGIEDAVFPELVRAHDQPGGAVQLWQRVNVLNCVIFFPAFVLLVYYAEPIVTTLFTSAYLPAVPVFIVFAFFLLRRCFNTDVLLRTTGQTGFVLWGVIGALVINIALILLLSGEFGMIGPAIAFIAAEIALELYYAQQARRKLKMTIANLADWRNIMRIAVSCVFAIPILVAFGFLPGPELVRVTAASLLYFSVVLFAAYRLGVEDVGRVLAFAWTLLQRRPTS